MKKILTTITAILFLATGLFSQSNTTDEGVEINGIIWATRNVGSHGTFVDNPEDYGALFQWGRKGDGHEQRTSPRYPTDNANNQNGVVIDEANFDINGQIISSHPAYGKFIKQTDLFNHWRLPICDTLWNAGTETVPVKTVNDPCPAGWRVPTYDELASLADANIEWTTLNGVNGRRFGSGDNTLFLPAAGYRFQCNGSLVVIGSEGYYWSSSISSTVNSHFAYRLGLNSNNASIGNNGTIRACGMSVRCVKENDIPTAVNNISLEKEKTILGYYNIFGKKLTKESENDLYIILYDNGTSEKVIKLK